jgi:hypothetical protein
MTVPGLPARAEIVLALCDLEVDVTDALDWSTASERADARELLALSVELARDRQQLIRLRQAVLQAEYPALEEGGDA